MISHHVNMLPEEYIGYCGAHCFVVLFDYEIHLWDNGFVYIIPTLCIIPTFRIIPFKTCWRKARRGWGGGRRRSHFTLILTERWLPPKNVVSPQLDPLVCSYLQRVEGEWNDTLLPVTTDSEPFSLCDRVLSRFKAKYDIRHFVGAFIQSDLHHHECMHY